MSWWGRWSRCTLQSKSLLGNRRSIAHQGRLGKGNATHIRFCITFPDANPAGLCQSGARRVAVVPILLRTRTDEPSASRSWTKHVFVPDGMFEEVDPDLMNSGHGDEENIAAIERFG